MQAIYFSRVFWGNGFSIVNQDCPCTITNIVSEWQLEKIFFMNFQNSRRKIICDMFYSYGVDAQIYSRF